MGKGKRLRTQRQAREDQQPAADDVLLGLGGLESANAFADLLQRHPELLTRASVEQLHQYAAAPQVGRPFALQARLRESAMLHRPDAFAVYRSAMNKLTQTVDNFREQRAHNDELIARGARGQALKNNRAMIEQARSYSYGPLLLEALLHHSDLLMRPGDGDRAGDLELAIEALREAESLVMDPRQAANVLMTKALATAQRLHGDRADNIDTAIDLLREALERLPEDERRQRALIQNNLASSLLRRENGEREANVREAIELCRSALEVRSVEHAPEDWAHTQLNFAWALEALAEGDATGEQALKAFEEVIRHRDRLDDWLVGAAYLGCGELHLDRTRRTTSAQAVIAASEAGRLDELFDTAEAAQQSLEAFKSALGLLNDDPDPTWRGRALAGVIELSADTDNNDDLLQAVALGSEAVQLLRPDNAPQHSRDLHTSLAGVNARLERWHEAAEHYRTALDAADRLLARRTTPLTREREMRSAQNVLRWAAYAFAKVDCLAEAAITLELGRARELRRRLIADHQGADDKAHERDQAMRDIHDACDDQAPLVYVDPSPAGTLLLMATRHASGELKLAARFLDSVSALSLYESLAPDDGGMTRYLLAAGVHGDMHFDSRSRQAIAHGIQRLGPILAQPIYEFAKEVAAQSIALVICGPIAAAPLHAATWQHSDRPQSLLDNLAIQHAPSANMLACSRRRAEKRKPQSPTFGALADPSPAKPLQNARHEVAAIGDLFDADLTRVACGEQASSSYLRTIASRCDFLHLACHGTTGLFERDGGTVELSDGPLTASQLGELDLAEARLVVLSACRTAHSAIADLPDEAESMASTLVGAGAAGAVVTMWPVDDDATALLMAKFYSEMMQQGRAPAAALRAAQLWLRDADIEELRSFAEIHPALRAPVEQAAERVPNGQAGPDGQLGRPYSEPYFWAPFIAFGS